MHINAKDVKFGLIFNAISIGVLVLFILITHITFSLNKEKTDYILEIFTVHPFSFAVYMIVFAAAIFGYVILHELTHGLFYKLLTRERLTFGMSWSCAFCGVPKIFVYRKAALIAVAAPLVIFTLILIPLTVTFYFLNPLIYALLMFIFGLHIGGCSGDLYLTLILLFKLKDPRTLIRDTGPEQFLYVPAKNDD